ncbi:DUF6913 domain-containing protein [Mesonia aestuariivivens]|uniref:Uncharacterized protein n=1 Tax=Mesonia aestuariivivens TaxID=2796128 RepID=A0ABS6W016_9FLAO|nr:hypothetical protein [Mesonia aestuariivivens]MBW2961193.1 hypothetical protein [Mesonia aestuariivivens]
MFQKLKIKSAKKYIENCVYGHRPKAVNNIEKLGVIVDENILNKISFEKLKSSFLQIGEQVEIILFSEKDSEDLKSFKKRDLGWKGVFKQTTEARRFQQNHFDVLINYFEETKPELILLGASTSANLKVGLAQQDKKLNDLQINVDALEVNLFLKELKKYIAIINK